MSTIRKALNKVQAQQLSRIQQDSVEHERQLRSAARRVKAEDAQSEVEKLLEKLREDFRHELFFLREENRLLSDKLLQLETASHGIAAVSEDLGSGVVQGRQLAERAGLQYCDDLGGKFDRDVVGLLPKAVIQRLRCLPLRKSSGGYVVAMVNPMNATACEELERLLDAEVIPVVVEMKTIMRATGIDALPRAARLA